MDDDLQQALSTLALDLRWSWNHSADKLWHQLDPELWALTHNPWLVLQTVSRTKLDAALADPQFHQTLDDVLADREQRNRTPRWFTHAHPQASLSAVAYFSMEFMLSDALPIYSGGLGNVAGDQLKAASDLGVPVIGIGLLYQQGYFRQHIDSAGNQIALRPFNDPVHLPIQPLRLNDGEWLRIPIQFPGSVVRARTWQVQVGNTMLYLLDTDDPENLPEYRGITSELYGGGPEIRLQQERVLGIGGWRLLRALGVHPEVCHLNEGHAAFAVLERARAWMEDNRDKGVSFPVALTATRAGNLFTTHTPVAAGFDRFAPELMKDRFTHYSENELGLPIDQLLALGRANPADNNEPFNMALLAIRGSGAVNGVSRLHGEVSRRIFQEVFPRWPESEVPVSHVTNGVHTPTWDSIEADELWTAACGKGRWHGNDQAALRERLRASPDHELWTMRQRARKSLVSYVRERLTRQLAGHGASPDQVEPARRILDPETLTMGFARRFATYKRPNLLLRDRDRLLRLLTNNRRPVQLVLAGKAHPDDREGQAMVREWIEFIRGTGARTQAVFLSDDDMGMTEHLVQGVDLWLNTPRRPWEACGTSGMKTLVNGGLNFSSLDGWWAEAYSPEVGWSLGDGQEHAGDSADAREAEELYTRLEQEVVPLFYERDESGIAVGWIAKMRESMARLTPQFSANRAVREYTEQHYLPLSDAFAERTKDGGCTAASLIDWRRNVEEHWSGIRFGTLNISTDGAQHTFSVQVWLDELNENAAEVELFADSTADKPPVRYAMKRGPALVGSEGGFTWTATIPAERAASDFTPRVVPRHLAAKVPLECQKILWYR
jgi:glycogen phosphorylase